MAGKSNGFTPTEQRILNVLSDYRPHTKAELRNVIDEMADDRLLSMHISNLRDKLAPSARNVMCTGKGGMYQLVSTTPPGYEE